MLYDARITLSKRILFADLLGKIIPSDECHAACYTHLGLLDAARDTIMRLRAITPEVMVNYPLPFRDPRHRELYLSGLRLAAGEET